MSQYKVIQDIEAEDTIIGWMTPRQAIYAAIVLVSGGLWFMFAGSGAWWLGIIFLPHMILFTVLAGPFVHDQPSEVWLLAKIKFFLQPRKRIWDQSGLKELVTVTVPKKIEKHLTDGLSQTEVKSRLNALANTLDSRGWAVKNIANNPYIQPGYANNAADRLLGVEAMTTEVPSYTVTAQDDILDETNNPRAQQLQQMIDQSQQAHRQQLVTMMQQPQPAQAATANNWFMPHTQSIQQTPISQPAAQPDVSVQDQQALLDKIHAQKAQGKQAQSHLRTIAPLGDTADQAQPAQATVAQTPAQPKPVTTEPVVSTQVTEAQAAVEHSFSPRNQQLAQSNDRSVDSLSREANNGGEVVISLH